MAEEQATTVLTGKQIMAEVAERSGVDLESLPVMMHYVWVARRTAMDVQVQLTLEQSKPDWAARPDVQKMQTIRSLMAEMDPMLLTRFGSWPMGDALIFALFQDETEVRVYTIPKMGKDMTEAPPKIANRYRIAKANPLPVYGVDAFTFDAWMDAVAQEMEAVESEEDPAEAAVEEEREKVISYLESLPADYLMKDAIEDLDEELHLVEREEEDEPGEVVSPANGSSPQATAVAEEPAGTQNEAAEAPAS